MKKQTFLSLCLCLAIFMVSCKTNEYGFTKKDVRSSQKLMGLYFEKMAVDTMYQYLGRNKRGYDTLRKYPVANETFPALTFDPHPSGFEIPKKQQNAPFVIPDNVELPSDKEQLAFFTIPQLASLIKNRKITSLELTQLYIDRIKRFDNQLQSVITLTEALGLEQARKADREIAGGDYKGMLHGIPYGIKDLAAVKGYPTTWGAEPYKDQMIGYNATIIDQLEAQGAVLIAKLVSGSLARGDVWFGGKTKNPWDLSQGASGSSAGPGSATSAGLVAFSIGTETLGSITSPSSRNGVTGLRPTYGRVSRFGVMSLSWSMDKLGPICRSAMDCEIVFNAIYGKDPKDPTTNAAPFNRATKQPGQMRVAYLKKDIDRDSSSTGNNLRSALAVFKTMGVEPTAIELPDNYPFNVFDIILRAEAGAFFDDLVRSGDADNMVEQTRGSRANSLRQARFIPAVEYLQANRQRRQLIEEVNDLFMKYDVIIAQTSRGSQLQITNLTGHPVVTIPTGFDNRGRPTSLTLIGNLYDEGAILAMADAFQQATDFDEKYPPLFSKK